MGYEQFASPIPFHEHVVTSEYGPRSLNGKPERFHDALDIGVWASSSEPIPLAAVASGKISIGKKRVSGQFVKIIHDTVIEGITSSFYCHLVNDSPLHIAGLKNGDRVEKGQIIGLMGDTGSASRRRNPSGGRHLHFMIFKSGKHADPEPLIRATSDEKPKKNTKYDENHIKHWVFIPKTNRNDKAAIIQGAREAVQKFNLELTEGSGSRELEEITDDDLRASALAFYLPRILEERVKSKSATDNGIIRLRTKNSTPYAHNLIFSKIEQRKYPDFSLLTTNEISNLVPFVEIYVINKLGYNKENHVMFPFDDYSQKIKIENIFYDKTGRGGNIGIKSVDWKTIGTNQSNVSQVRVNIKINIQDIQDIETKRNGVSLLDLLYPAGTRNSHHYDDKNFNIKLKLGWLYKMNPSLSGLRDKISEQLLEEVIFVSLYKHEFDFSDTGSVLLSLEYVGMLESKLSNPFKYDVLEKIVPEKKKLENKVKTVKALFILLKDLNEAIGKNNKELAIKLKEEVKTTVESMNNPDIKLGEGDQLLFDTETQSTLSKTEYERIQLQMSANARLYPAGSLDGYREVKSGSLTKYVKDYTLTKKIDLNNPDDEGFLNFFANFFKIDVADLDDVEEQVEKAEKDLSNSYLTSLQNLLVALSNKDSIKYLTIDQESVSSLKNLSTVESTTLSKQNLDNLIDTLNSKSALNPSETSGSTGDNSSKNEKEGEKIKTAFKEKEILESDDSKITINKELILKSITEGITGQIVIPYTFLGEIISHYNSLMFGKTAIDSKNSRVVLGDFSYRDVGDTQDDEQGANTNRPKTLKHYTNKDGIGMYKQSTDKKYASLADIPISIESLISWYNENVADPGLERMSYNSFLRSIFSNLIPANLTNQITDVAIGVSRHIITSFNYLDVKENSRLEKQLLASSKNKNYIEIPFSNADAKKSKFYKLKSRANFKETRNVQMQNYLFILSSNEREYASLKGNYRSDRAKDIFHFYIGEDKGLVKNIKFVKEDNPGLDATNVLKANQGDSHQSIIRRIYQGEVTLFGNTMFTPGQLIFLAPTYPGSRLRNKTLQRVGLGGYYRIIEIESYIEDNKFETKLKTKWQASGFGLEKEIDSIEVFDGEGGVQEEEIEEKIKNEEFLEAVGAYDSPTKEIPDEIPTAGPYKDRYLHDWRTEASVPDSLKRD